MHSIQRALKHACLAAAVGVFLAACGGGGGGGGDPGNGGTVTERGTEIPQSALQSVDGLLAYVRTVIDTMTNSTSEPIHVGDAVLPTSDTAEPAH